MPRLTGQLLELANESKWRLLLSSGSQFVFAKAQMIGVDAHAVSAVDQGKIHCSMGTSGQLPGSSIPIASMNSPASTFEGSKSHQLSQAYRPRRTASHAAD